MLAGVLLASLAAAAPLPAPPAAGPQLLVWQQKPTLCLSGPASLNPPATVTMAPCNAKDKNQLWTQKPDPSGGKFIVNAGSNDCLNAVQTGGVTVTTCTQGLMDVQWSYCPPTMKCKGQMISGSTNFCLTVKGTKLTPSQAACSTAKSDLWTWKSADEQ